MRPVTSAGRSACLLGTPSNILADWFARSCGLEFINHVDEETFTNCIEQGDLEVIKIYSQFDEE